MPTTIQIDEKTREELLRFASDLQAKLGRKVTFDEAIRTLMGETRGVRDAREKLDSLFGSLAREKTLWRELEATRKRERVILKRKVRST